MALRTKLGPDDWIQLLTSIGIPADSAKIHADSFVKEGLTRDSLSMLDRDMLKELGITSMGDALAVLKFAKEQSTTPLECYTKAPAVKLPQLHSEMTSQQFRKFKIDWEVFTRMSNMPPTQASIQLYNCADEAVQNSIINTYPNFFSDKPDRLMDQLESLVTQKSNPMVHRLSFASMTQSLGESIQQFVVRLRGAAQDCDFTCPCCNYNLSDFYIKDQLVRGIANDSLQADLLAKASSLRTLEQNISHAEAFEAALRDQSQMAGTLDMAALRLSAYRRKKKSQSVGKSTPQSETHINRAVNNRTSRCAGCGSREHGIPGTNTRQQACPAWDQACNLCDIRGHFAIVCRSKTKSRPGMVGRLQDDGANMDSLIAHIEFDQQTGSYVS